MMVPTNDEKNRSAYHTFRKMEDISMESCHRLPTDDEIAEDPQSVESFTADPSNPEESGTINQAQAVSLVHQYISKIRVDRFTKLAPCWVCHEQPGIPNPLLNALGIHFTGFSCVCHMPHKTPFTEPVQGPVLQTKKLAKQACALEVVRRLYAKDELNIRLQVKKREVDLEDEEEEEDDCTDANRGRKVGTTRRRAFYEVSLPTPLNKKPRVNNLAYLYKVEMSLIEEIDNARYEPYYPQGDFNSLGIILDDRLASNTVGPFDLYGPCGTLKVQLQYVTPVRMDKDLLKQAEQFHQFAFTEVLKIQGLEYTEESLLLVPLCEGEICFDLFRDRSADEITDQSVIYPAYKKADLTYYFVEKFLRDVTPTSIMDQNVTYDQYYLQHYRIKIKDLNQPLVTVSSADRNYFMFNSGGERRKDKASSRKHLHFVPELMKQADIPAGLWRQIQIFLFFMERVSSLLHAESLSCRLTGHQQTQRMSQLSYQNCEDSTSLWRKFTKFDTGCDQEPVNLLTSLTLQSASDVMNMERQEILGDAFLKYRASMYLYYTKPTDFDEGKLTSLRSKIVGNKNLFRVAKDIGLHKGGVNSVKIQAHTTYLPPGFTASQEKRLINLDEQFPSMIDDEKKRKTLSVGSFLHYINKEDMQLNDEELLNLAVGRFLKKE